jgi:hypothetical protein
MFPQPQQSEIPMEELAKEIKRVSTPIEEKAKKLFQEISTLQAAMDEKVRAYSCLCASDDLKEIDNIYQRGIELLKKFVDKQSLLIKELQKEERGGTTTVNWRNMSAKLEQINYKIKDWMEQVPIIEAVVKI